jgi:GNAT superfamily N-acetyltransferase
MGPIQFRRAERADLEAIIDLLWDDELGRTREDNRRPLNPDYLQAFEAICRDKNQYQLIAESEGQVIGTLQISFIPGLARCGAWRGQIEAVRIHRDFRSAGLGQLMLTHAMELCRARGCYLVQLTSDKTRHDAHRFYERLGFKATHDGFKLQWD